MTQEPQNPETSKPPETPASAWAPRSQPPASPETPEVTASDASAPDDAQATADPAPRVWAPPTLAGTTISPASTASSDAAASDEAVSPAVQQAATDPAPPPAAVVERKRGVPVWLLAIAAIVPAVVVGAVVYFVFGSSEDNDSTAAAGIVDGFMRLGQPDQSNVTSYAGELPPDFAPDFPLYEDAEVVVSIANASEQGTNYLIVMSTPDPAGEVFTYYGDVLDRDPWQVEISRSSEEFTGLRFLRPDNIDVSGNVSLHRSELDEQTVIYLSYSDISQAILPGGPTDPFTVGVSRELPAGFPQDIPIYQGAEESVILDTYRERGQGGQAFIVTFLTRDSQDAVIEYYRGEFEGRGWVVSDAGVSSTSFALAIEFDNGPEQSISGSITADSFEEDPAYTQVDLLVTTSNN